MGMDLIEIIVRVEDAFGIKIPDAEATKITTPRELADFVAAKVLLSDAPSCLSQQSFYFLRRRFQPHLSFSRKSFLPNALLEDFVPKRNRRLLWTTLQSEFGANALPELARPIWLFFLLAASTVFVFFYIAFSVWNTSGSIKLASFFGLAAAIGFGYIAAAATRPAKQHFRRNYKRAGDAARYLAANKPHIFKSVRRTWMQTQIMEVIREIIGEQVGSQNFSDDAHFINDLNLN